MNEIRILLVEDEKKIADSLLKGLSENNYMVDVAYDGFSGKEKMDSGNYNLIILDINLPGMNGFELSRRNRLKKPHVPVIMLTALNTKSHKIEGFDAGADDYIV